MSSARSFTTSRSCIFSLVILLLFYFLFYIVYVVALSSSSYLLIAVPSFVILCLSPSRGICVNLSTIWILDALRICTKMPSRGRFVMVTTLLESLVLVPWSRHDCIPEAWEFPSYIVLNMVPISRSPVATRKLSTNVC